MPETKQCECCLEQFPPDLVHKGLCKTCEPLRDGSCNKPSTSVGRSEDGPFVSVTMSPQMFGQFTDFLKTAETVMNEDMPRLVFPLLRELEIRLKQLRDDGCDC